MASQSSLQRDKWSDADFESMSWHDVHIHGFGAIPSQFAVVFDVDYILEWIASGVPGEPLRFLIAPATLLFENAGGIDMQLATQQGIACIQTVERHKRDRLPGDSVESWLWKIKCNEGKIEFEASGFKLALRRSPILSGLQVLDTDQRGPPSFDSASSIVGDSD